MGMPQLPVTSPSPILDLGNQRRLNPYEILAAASVQDWRRAPLDPVEHLPQIVRDLLREAGTHRADIDELVAATGRQEQTPNPSPRRHGMLVADNHEAVGLDALDLEPVAKAAGTIGAVEPLSDDALKAVVASGLKQRFSIVASFLREANSAFCCRPVSSCRGGVGASIVPSS